MAQVNSLKVLLDLFLSIILGSFVSKDQANDV